MALYNREGARRALLHTVGFRVLSQGAAVLGYIVLIRSLSETSIGIYSLLYAVIPIITTVGSLGLDQVLKRFQPEFLGAGRHRAANSLLVYVSLARFASSAAVIVLLLLAWRWVAPLFQLQAHRADFALLSLVVVLYFQVAIMQVSIAAHMLHRYSVGSAIVLSLGKLVAYLVLAERGVLTLRQAILADTIAYVLTYAFLSVVHLRKCRALIGSDRYRPNPEECARMRRYALVSNLSDASSLLLFVQTDNLFIGALMNPLAVGTYAFYTRLNEMTLNLTPVRFFENVINPLFFSAPADRAAERLPRYFTLLVNVSLMAQLPMIAYVVSYHHEVVDVLFGGKFIEYSALLPVVVAFAISDNVISTPVTMIAQYSERTSLILKSQLFGLYQIAAMLALIPLAGLYGAAIATGTLHLFRNLYVWWRMRALARWLNWAAALVTGLFVWGLAASVCVILKSVTNLSPLSNMICGVVIFAVAGIFYLRSPALSHSDRQLVGDVLHGRESIVLKWIGIGSRA